MPDPFTLLSLGLTASSALGGAVGRSLASAPYRNQNNRELRRLRQLQASGQLGLTDEARRGMEQALITPIQEAAMNQQRQGERVGAAMGGAGFGARELSALRQDTARTIGQNEAQARGRIELADQAEEQRQRFEMDQRAAARSAEQLQQLEAILQAADTVGGMVGQYGQVAGQQQVARAMADTFGSQVQNADIEGLMQLRNTLGQERFDALLREFVRRQGVQ